MTPDPALIVKPNGLAGETPTPKLFIIDLTGIPVPCHVGAGLLLEMKGGRYELRALALPRPATATVVGQMAIYQDDESFLLPQPVPQIVPQMIAGLAVYRNGRRMRMDFDYKLSPDNPLRLMPNRANPLVARWVWTDYVCADYVAHYT